MPPLSRFVRTLLAFTFLAAVFAVAPSADSAVGTVDLSWNACSPVVASMSRGAPGPILMTASVTGHDVPHQQYTVFLYVYEPPGFPLKDAWRFDAAGCQGSSRIDIRHIPPGSLQKACPPFSGINPTAEIESFQFDPFSQTSRLLLNNAYPAGVTNSDPAKRYFLMSAMFDHTSSVVVAGTPGLTCGGFEQDIRISFTPPPCAGCSGGASPPRWLDVGGVEREFLIGQGSLTFCGSCEPVPAEATTWGAIKAAYR